MSGLQTLQGASCFFQPYAAIGGASGSLMWSHVQQAGVPGILKYCIILIHILYMVLSDLGKPLPAEYLESKPSRTGRQSP